MCKDYCYSSISLDSHPNLFGGWGKTDPEYEAQFPTGPTVVMPQMGYSYGVPQTAFPVPMAVPVGQPMTAVVAQPVFTPVAVPMAVPLETPVIGQAVTYDPVPMAVPSGEEGFSVTSTTTTTTTWLQPTQNL